jgi:hypothetical protein
LKKNLLTKQYALQKSRDLLKGLAVLIVSGMSLRLQPAETAVAQNMIHLDNRLLPRTLTNFSSVNRIALDSSVACCYGYHALANADKGHTATLIIWFALLPDLHFTCFRTATGGDDHPVRVNFSGWYRTAINLTPANNPIPGTSSDAEGVALSLINGKQAYSPRPGEGDLSPLHNILQS